MLKTMMVAAALAAVGAASPALAADNAMQACGAKYQAAKAGKTLPAGQTWPQFLAACRATLPKTAAATPVAAKPASAPAKVIPAKATPASAAPSKVAGQPSAAQLAARSRQKQCAQTYQADKAANKLAGQSWPKYYSACSARLKA